MIRDIKSLDTFNTYEITFDNGKKAVAHLVGSRLQEVPERFGTVGILRFDFDEELTETKLKENKK